MTILAHRGYKYLAMMDEKGADGLIMTMKAYDPKWSFVEFALDGSVAAVCNKAVKCATQQTATRV